MSDSGSVYREVAGFIAENTAPAALIAFRPSEEAQQRVSDLIFREKYEGLTPEETEELNGYMGLEHVMRMAKALAHRRTGSPTADQR